MEWVCEFKYMGTHFTHQRTIRGPNTAKELIRHLENTDEINMDYYILISFECIEENEICSS